MTFHDIWWHEPDGNFDDIWWHFWNSFAIITSHHSHPDVIKCHVMSFNLTWWHLMTCMIRSIWFKEVYMKIKKPRSLYPWIIPLLRPYFFTNFLLGFFQYTNHSEHYRLIRPMHLDMLGCTGHHQHLRANVTKIVHVYNNYFFYFLSVTKHTSTAWRWLLFTVTYNNII